MGPSFIQAQLKNKKSAGVHVWEAATQEGDEATEEGRLRGGAEEGRRFGGVSLGAHEGETKQREPPGVSPLTAAPIHPH